MPPPPHPPPPPPPSSRPAETNHFSVQPFNHTLVSSFILSPMSLRFIHSAPSERTKKRRTIHPIIPILAVRQGKTSVLKTSNGAFLNFEPNQRHLNPRTDSRASPEPRTWSEECGASGLWPPTSAFRSQVCIPPIAFLTSEALIKGVAAGDGFQISNLQFPSVPSPQPFNYSTLQAFNSARAVTVPVPLMCWNGGNKGFLTL